MTETTARLHKMTTEGGRDIGDQRWPICSCGWKGYSQGNYCSAQHTNFQEQFAKHVNQALGRT